MNDQKIKNKIMKKNILNCLLVLFAVNVSFSQTTATDFITNDCNGISHNLFDSLDDGNVIVIAWVMPCGPCATYSLPAYSAVQSFTTSHPGQVHFYMADDYANTACSTLMNWGNNYNMPNSTFFSSSAVNMNGYGTAGMPKVVVLGGVDRHIYFNENDTKINLSDVQIAIDSALNNFVSSTKELESNFKLNIFSSNNLNNLCFKLLVFCPGKRLSSLFNNNITKAGSSLCFINSSK